MSEVLLVGLDLCGDFTQMACRHPRMPEPESVGKREGEEEFLIPTCLAIREESREWVYGTEAVRQVEEGSAVSAGELLERAAREEAVGLCGIRFLPEDLLERFLRKVLLLLKEAYPEDTIRHLTVTIEERGAEEEEKIRGALKAALLALGLSEERASIRSHKASFLYYALGQKQILIQSAVALFEFRNNGLKYVQLDLNRKTSPVVADVTERDFSEYLKLERVTEDPKEAERTFRDLSAMAVHRQTVTVIYAVGRGFDGPWADGALGALCTGRKVFKGQNLYAKGACYAAEAKAEGQEGEVLFLGENRTHVELSMEIYKDGKTVELQLAGPAESFRDAGGEWEFILDRVSELEILVKDCLTRKKERHLIPMEGLPQRERKMTRIRLSVRFTDRNTCLIQVRDLGFGEFAPAGKAGMDAGHMWETILTF